MACLPFKMKYGRILYEHTLVPLNAFHFEILEIADSTSVDRGQCVWHLESHLREGLTES